MNTPADESFDVADEPAMQALGRHLAHSLPARAIVTLSGDLGAGKSVLARAMLHALGHVGPVPSPTYAIVESYRLSARRVAHLDLYRLVDPGELHDIGFDDVVAEHDTLLIEWPERGAGLLPAADVRIAIETVADTGGHVGGAAGDAAGDVIGTAADATDNETERTETRRVRVWRRVAA